MPPYSELPLRDALSASPETLATLPEAARVELAQRLMDEQALEGDEATAAQTMVPAIAAVVESADESREVAGKDALVLGAIDHSGDGFSLRALAIDEASEGPHDLPVIEGGADAPTKALEDKALRGRAGAVLSRMAAQSGAPHIVRVTGWPAGAVVADGKIYVNASWLVALSALEKDEGEGKVSVVGIPRAGYAPMLKPQSIDLNPYDLPTSIDVCAQAVEAKCACASSSSCSHEPADSTFPDANAECSWVNQEAANAEALCVLALLSVTELLECVQKGYPACETLPVTDRTSATAFAADPVCAGYLDDCLSVGKAAVSTGSSGNGSSCGSCDNNCDPDCSPDCDSPDCNNNCNSPDCNKTCDNPSCKGGSCSLAKRRRRPRTPDGAPFAPMLMAASFIYIYSRVRRQS